MSAFTPAEIEYLQNQQLDRLATANREGEPHMAPTSFRYNAALDTIGIGGHNLAASKKFRDARRTRRAAFVVDHVLPPWQARGVEVRGRAEVLEEGGEGANPHFDTELIRLYPTRSVGWGIDTDASRPNSRSVG
jgi:pyridoxamine 5'-phosphate oxidase family protein